MMLNKKRSKNKILFIICLFLLLLSIFYVKTFNRSKEEKIIYELYLMSDPSIVDFIFKHTESDFRNEIKISVLEKFKNGEIVCVEYFNYATPFSKLYLVTKNNTIIDFDDGKLIGNNFHVYFDLNAFNFYLKETSKHNLSKQIILEKIFYFLGKGCQPTEFYFVKDIADIDAVLKKNSSKRNFFRKNQIDYDSVFKNKNGFILWHSYYGIIRVSLMLNPDSTVKFISIARIGYLGNEKIDL